MENKIIFELRELGAGKGNINIADKENALAEINNLLATKVLLDIKIEEIQRIASRYKVNLKKEFGSEWLDFYRVYLSHCLTDKYLSDEELADLKHLKYLLTLTDREIDNLHKEIAGEIYREELELAMSDGRISEEERSFLKKLQADLHITEDMERKIFQESAFDIVRKFLRGVMSDRRLAPDEEEELGAIAGSFGITLEFTENTKRLLDKYRFFWQIENNQIPEIFVPIQLNEGEKCYYYSEAQWHCTRRPSANVDTTDLEIRIKIAKGIYYTLLNPHKFELRTDSFECAGEGLIYITNQRLFFRNKHQEKEFQLEELCDLQPYTNGIQFLTHDGYTVFLELTENVDVLLMLTGKAVNDLN